jgi:pilus assembly protein CpaB
MREEESIVKSQIMGRLLRPEVLLAVLAIGAGVAGALFAGRYIAARAAAVEASFEQRYASRSVVVAAADLASGELLEVSKLAARPMPKDFLPADVVSAEDAAELLGGRAAIDIRRGAPLLRSAVERDHQNVRMSGLLPAGHRALTIPVDQENSLAGHLAVGDRVDLYYTRAENGEARLAPLLQQVAVLAVGESLGGLSGDPADPAFSSITLALTADDAARVVLAQQSGSLSVVLRTPGDTAPSQIVTRSSRQLTATAGASPRAAPRVELLIGGEGGVAPRQSWLTTSLRSAGERS